MMRREVTAVGVLALLVGVPGLTASEPETVTMRGQTFQVWPVEDLIERGFDEMTPVPKEENAAWVYIDAINAYEDLPAAVEDAFEHALKVGWPEGEEELVEYLMLPENRRALELAVKASSMRSFRMPYFGDPKSSVLSILLPNLSHLRYLSKLMVVDARRLENQKKYDEALKRFLAVMQMGKHVNGDFTLIGNLVGFAIWNIGETGVLDMVLRQPLSRKQLSEIQRELSKLNERLPSIDRGLRGEQTFGPAVVDELCSRPLASLMNLKGFYTENDILGFALGNLNANPADGWGELELRIGRLIYPDRAIKRHMQGYYDKVLEMAEKGPRDTAAMAFDEERYIAEEIPKWDIVPRVLLPSLSRAIVLGERLKTVAAMTRAIVAIRLNTLQHEGQPPSSLDQIAETLPEGALVDPFSGELFAYRPTSDGWILYSFGPGLVDDGGQKGERWDKLDMVHQYPPEPVQPFRQEGDGR